MIWEQREGNGEHRKKKGGRRKERWEGRGGGLADTPLSLSVSLQICSQPHLRCAQLQGSAGQVGQGPSLGGVGPCLAVLSSLPFSEMPLPSEVSLLLWCELHSLGLKVPGRVEKETVLGVVIS